MTRSSTLQLVLSSTLLCLAGAAPARAQLLEQRVLSPYPNDPYQFGVGLAIEGDRAFAIDLALHLSVFERGPAGWAITKVEDLNAGEAYVAGIAVDGDRMAVGGGTGAAPVVHMFERDPASGWVLGQTITGPAGAFLFGRAVDIRGDEVIVGAPGDSAVQTNAGRAYVLRRDTTTAQWAIVARLESPTPAFTDEFGATVRFGADGDEILVGAPRDDAGGNDVGAVHRFLRAPAGWIHAGRILPASPKPFSQFGRAMDAAGEVLAVGAPETVPVGAVHVFRRAGGAWSEAQALYGPPESLNPKLGTSVSLDGDRLAVGCPPERVDRGAVLLYRRGPAGYELEARYAWPEQFSAPWWLGRQVALSDGQLMTSAPLVKTSSFPPNIGAVYFGSYADELRPYCFCAAPAPCGNPIATTGCRPGMSVAGAQLGGTGSTSVSADDLGLGLEGLPAGSDAVVFMSPASSSPTVLGDGLRCAGAPVFRFAPVTADALGRAQVGPGVVGLAALRFPPEGQIAAGDTWYFQGWYRSPDGPCGTGSNLTSALAVDFVP